jgi:sigma-B regulation protein RsbU (phosphoserine phosphatase)
MISALLEEEGYEVALAVDGRQGLERARESAPELILTDYEMPEMDGPTLCQALKADRALRAIPVVMLTTLGATESKVIGLNAGADDYIQKPQAPQDIQELFARIRAQLRIADLRRELAERNALLEAMQAKLTLELNLARKVQLGLMPRPPKPRGAIRLAVSYEPANALGGDVYDFARLDETRLGALMADISGHGVNAALLSGMVKTLAAPLIGSDTPPGPMLAGLDTAAEQYFPEGFFCTAFYLRIDEHTGAFDYAGVGHPAALVVGPAGTRPLDSEPGLLGVGMAAATETRSDTLQPGESLLLYTDGLPDAMDPSDASFGQDRIQAILEEHQGAEPSVMIDRIKEALARHVEPGQPHDDVNLILIRNLAR